MFRLFLSRPIFMKMAWAVFMVAQMFGWVSYARATEPASPAAPSSSSPPPSSRSAVRAAMREFDSFLDHHPVLEDQLRLNPQLSVNSDLLEKNHELRAFLAANPNVVEGLKIFPRYCLFRALVRQATSPLSVRDLAPFKEIFLQQPKLEQALNENPALIHDAAFLDSYPALRECLAQHAALAHGFQPKESPPRAQ